MEENKHILTIIGRSLLILIAALFILLSIAGIGGSWYVNRMATEVTLKAFSVVETGVSVANMGVDQALGKVKDSRSEIMQTQEDITTLGQNLKENHPALTALSQRLDERLAPSVGKIRSALEPVRDGLTAVNTVLLVANSIPHMEEKAPGLKDAQEALDTIASLSADITQLRTTLRAAAAGQADALSDETTTLLLNITGRIDERLARTQEKLEQVQSKINALQEEVARKKARLLFTYNMIAALATLMFLWLIYSQMVVIAVQVQKLRGGSRQESSAVPPPAEALTPPSAETVAAVDELADVIGPQTESPAVISEAAESGATALADDAPVAPSADISDQTA